MRAARSSLWETSRTRAGDRAAAVFRGRLGAAIGYAMLALSAGHACGQSLQRLEIVTASGVHGFQIELADTPEKWKKGLMFRRSMAPNEGMLFDLHEERPISMWMKDTYIRLDMVFVGRDGVVNRIEAGAPLSQRSIDGGIAYAVIELNGGVAEKIGLKPGDLIRHPAFARREGAP